MKPSISLPNRDNVSRVVTSALAVSLKVQASPCLTADIGPTLDRSKNLALKPLIFLSPAKGFFALIRRRLHWQALTRSWTPPFPNGFRIGVALIGQPRRFES